MKKFIVILAFTFTSTALFAQRETKTDSKWKSTIDGQTYQMEISATGASSKSAEKPHLSFSIKGDLVNLSKVTLTSKESSLTVPVSKEKQDINVAPGQYKFKFYHDKMGVQEFEVNLKTGADKTVVLTIK